MNYLAATLVKLETANGFWTVKTPAVAVGQRYIIHPATRRTNGYHHLPSGTDHDTEVVEAYQGDGTWNSLPVELLEITTTEVQPARLQAVWRSFQPRLDS